jgi:UDP-N-acetylglucosamine 3-dehydrogenase
MVKVGVVGVGSMGQYHARLYSELDCELVGVADINFERAKEIGVKYGTNYYKDYRVLLDKVDAVSVAVPTLSHGKVALDFIRRGIHCLIEKPIASNLEEAKEMIEEAKKNRVKLMVGHIERFNPAVIKLKELVEKGALGKLLILSIRRVGPVNPRVKETGVILDFATHDIDIARYMVGKEPLNVFAKFGSIKNERDDHAVVILDFGETTAVIEANWLTPHKVRSLVATGTHGIAYLDYIEQNLEIYDAEWKKIPEIKKEEPLRLELKHFLDCVKNDKKPLVDGEEGLKVLEIALKAYGKSK